MMQSRLVVNLINQTSIAGDWENVTREECEKEISDKFLPNFSSLSYFNMTVNGKMRIVIAKAITDFFIEERMKE